MWSCDLMIVTFLMIQKVYKINWKFLIYLTITKSNIIFIIEVLSRFIHQSKEIHWIVALRILAYVKSSRRKGLLYKHGHVRISEYSDSDYTVTKGVGNLPLDIAPLLEKNFLTWRRKKQDMISPSSTEAEYKAMTHTACEMMWLKNLMLKLDFTQSGHIICIVIISLLYILPKIMCFIRAVSTLSQRCLDQKVVSLTPPSKQLADLLTKTASPQVFSNLCSKMGIIDIYTTAWREVLNNEVLGFTLCGGDFLIRMIRQSTPHHYP